MFQKNQNLLGFPPHHPDMSEAEVLGIIMRGHEPMTGILFTRSRGLRLVISQVHSKDLKTAVETALAMGDDSVLIDMLGVINSK